jgi:cell division protein ZapE
MKLTLDSQQILVQEKLAILANQLKNKASEGFFKKIIAPKNQLKSFYIYGDVGRGKSMLMREFFDSLSKTSKVYFHFNAFMRKIHEALRDIRKEEKKVQDELIEAVKRVVEKSVKTICFDEFQVTDIADAMLLSRIFSYIFAQEITVVFTSNSKPQQLYKNGLQRELFLEFVEKTLLKNCEVLYLNSPTDYRSQYRQNLAQRYFVSNQKNREEVKKIIESFTEGKKPKSQKLKIWGREVLIKKTFVLNDAKTKKTSKIAIFNFDDLCKENFAASDYQAICQNFDLIFLLKLPKLNEENVNEAKRFLLFIDEIYENKTALIVLAKSKSEKIYESGIGSEAFKRTVSRLNEIKSDTYWQNSKVNF